MLLLISLPSSLGAPRAAGALAFRITPRIMPPLANSPFPDPSLAAAPLSSRTHEDNLAAQFYAWGSATVSLAATAAPRAPVGSTLAAAAPPPALAAAAAPAGCAPPTHHASHTTCVVSAPVIVGSGTGPLALPLPSGLSSTHGGAAANSNCWHLLANSTTQSSRMGSVEPLLLAKVPRRDAVPPLVTSRTSSPHFYMATLMGSLLCAGYCCVLLAPAIPYASRRLSFSPAITFFLVLVWAAGTMACNSGYYSCGVNGFSCCICDVGFYCVHDARFPCPEGTYNPTIARTSSTQCLPCPGGTYSPQRASSCTKCEAVRIFCDRRRARRRFPPSPRCSASTPH
jgi:hypothetical protein